MISYRQMSADCLELYDRVEMRLTVKRVLKIEKENRGLGGFRFVETPVEPYVRDFNKDPDDSATRWGENFDLSNWAFFMAFDGKKPVGAAAVASRTKNVNMLAGRDDLAVLWDIRVEEKYKSQGVGQHLFGMAADWARGQGLVQMKIECQNDNVPAVRFYHGRGARLCMINEYAYYGDPDFGHTAQLIWYLDL